MFAAANRSALALFAFALAIRILALWAARDAELVLDEKTYALRAEALLDGQGFVGSYQSWVRHSFAKPADLPQYPGAWQAPGYTAFIAGILALSGRSLFAVKLVQVLLGSLSVLLVFAAGRAWFGARAGLAAGWLAACYPNLIAFSHYLFSETLFIFLFLAALVWLTPHENPPRRAAAVAGGVLLGLAALIRGALFYLLPLVAGWIVLRYRARWRRALVAAALMLVAAGSVILPWAVRNTRLHGGVVLIDTNGPYNLWRGNGPGAFEDRCSANIPRYPWPFDCIPVLPVWNREAWTLIADAKRELGKEQPTDLEIVHYARSAAWREIRADPATFVRRMMPRLVDMWNPTSFLVRHLQVGAYGAVPPALSLLLIWLAVLSYLIVVGFALAGAWCERKNPHTWLIALFIVAYSAISAVSFGLTRFRLVLEPLLLILAGVAVIALVDLGGKGRQAATIAR